MAKDYKDITDEDETLELIEDLLSDDPLAMVVRGHIRIELKLHEYLRTVLPCPEYLDQNIEYSNLVSIALAAGLDKTAEIPLRAVGNLRNTFSHRLCSISEQDANNLYQTLPSEEKARFHKTLEDVHSDIGAKYADFSPTEQISWVILTIFGIVSSEIDIYKNKQEASKR